MILQPVTVQWPLGPRVDDVLNEFAERHRSSILASRRFRRAADAADVAVDAAAVGGAVAFLDELRQPSRVRRHLAVIDEFVLISGHEPFERMPNKYELEASFQGNVQLVGGQEINVVQPGVDMSEGMHHDVLWGSIGPR